MKALKKILILFFYNKLRNAHIRAFFRYNSLPKFINLLRNIYEKKTVKVQLSSKPFLINSEPTNYCNYSCPFCQTTKLNCRPKGFGDISLFEKVLKQTGKYIYLMTIHGWGEPLLHKELIRIIELAHQQRIYTVISTNASMLNPELSEKLILSGLDQINLSLDGITNNTYRKYRIGGDYDKIIENVKELVSLKKKLRSPHPFIEWQFLVFKHNEHEIHAAKKIARKVGADNIVFLPSYTEDSQFESSDPKYRLLKNSPLSKPKDCRHLWSTISFHWNGMLVPCCYDHQGKNAFGNLYKETFFEIWNNDKMKEARMIIKKGPAGYSEDLFCNFCIRNIQKS